MVHIIATIDMPVHMFIPAIEKKNILFQAV